MIRIAWAVLRVPQLWPTAARVARSTVPPRWWCRRPFLPVPSRPYLEFRLTTQYGGGGQRGGADTLARRDNVGADIGADAVAYLHWCRSWYRSQSSR